MIFTQVILLCTLTSLTVLLNCPSVLCKKVEDEVYPMFNTIPMHEVLQNSLYLSLTQYGEIVVSYTGKGADLRPDDYVTHADGIKILTGSLQSFLESGVRETVVPVVDEEDVKYGGKRLLGFVMMKSVMPRKLGTRRGEIDFDLEEGGQAPMLTVGDIMIGTDGSKQTGGEEYVPPPNGGGQCITARDCYYFNGTCHDGSCECLQNRTGTYCQLEKAEKTGIADVIAKHKESSTSKPDVFKVKEVKINPDAPKPVKEQKLQVKRKPGPKLEEVVLDSGMEETAEVIAPLEERPRNDDDMVPIKMTPRTDAAPDNIPDIKEPKGKKRLKKGSKKGKGDDDEEEDSSAEPKPVAKKPRKDKGVPDEDALYGPNGLYPAPYIAGKSKCYCCTIYVYFSFYPVILTYSVPHEMAYMRLKQRKENQPFAYSVKFRNGPIGLAFDNLLPNATVVERVMNGMQAHQSDINVGDQLIAIDHHNTSAMSAKIAQKLLTSSPWPMVLTFQAKLAPEDPSLKKAEAAKSRTFNMTIIYPPTLTGEYEVRLTDWTAGINIYHEDACPVYAIRSAADFFGCNVDEGAYEVSN